MEKEQPQQEIFKKYLNLIFSRHKFIAVCVLLAVSAGLFYYISQPELYQSRASIMYQEQRINVSRSMGDDKRQFDEMVKTISQQVLSRNSLEKIIIENDLYSGMRQEVPIEDVIEQMREKDIAVRLEKDRGSVFTVSFKGPDPRRVVRVTNSLAARFIEENLQLREERASETASYIQDELEMAKEKLNRQEAQMRDYKKQYYNEMPEQRSANMSRLNALQEQYQAVQSNINELENTRFLVAEQLELRREMQQQSGSSGDFDAESAGEEQNSLAAARNRLQQLLTRYKENHPTVKRLKKRIAQLESQQQEMTASGNDAGAGGQGQESGAGMPDGRAGQLAAQLKSIAASLKDKRREAEELREKMAKYEQWIEAAPEREAEWSALTRDYDKLKEYHDKLLAQSLSADASQSLEARQKGSQFKIVDSAYTPRTPMKGTFSKTLLVCLAMGLAAGGGLVLGVDLMDTSFKRANEIESELGVPVVCALPLIVTKKEQMRNRIKNAAWYFGLTAWLIALSAAAVYFWQQGDIMI